MMKDLKAIQEALASSKNIVITTHANPDADALGSSLGWMHYLLSKGLNAVVITPTNYPDFLKWMPGNDLVRVFDKTDQQILDLVKNADMIFCLDFSDLKRIDEMGNYVRESNAEKVIVDHHRHPQKFGKYMVHSTEAAATAELIFDMIEGMDSEEFVTKEIAECLYAGIMTDTGSFRHSNVNDKVLHVASRLVSHGADASLIAKLIYDNNSINRLRFLGYALWELLKV
ncbi:MAG: bifunctional oligoribonuclease/PAP phosphatase NrnA, partial [Flavobacteriales bacterium]|nr:bifunctional oligoribonuclease/PAP phosphatase NrnA [Flavobacteriales bacterium]